MKLCLAVVLALSLLMAPACGAGGADDGSAAGLLPPTPLMIETAALPNGSTLAPYASTQLEASGADGAVTFGLRSGDLPTGLSLSLSGVLAGQPIEVGNFTFEIEAQDASEVVARSYDVAISNSFALLVSGGLVGSDAWSEAPVSLVTVGAAGTVTFSIVSTSSGGTFTTTNGAAGTATWLPGTIVDVDDMLQATDTGTGLTQSVTISVVQNPAPDQVAEFGSTDVWYVSTDVKNGTHNHRSDFMQALADMGLAPAGTGSETPTQLETLIESAARLALLRELNLIYLRDAGGTTGSGLDISFPFFAPDATLYTAPAETGQLSGGLSRYSIMECADLGPVGGGGVLGRAIYDVSNPRHDHDGGTDPIDSVRLGCFTDRIRSSFASWQSARLLTSDPVAAADQSVIEDILYGRASTGTRHDEIEELMVYFARALALVAAHEIGHSVGMDHNGGGDFLMAPSIGFSNASLSTSNAVPFTTAEITTLRNSNLPGAGRTNSLYVLPKFDPAPIRIVALQAQTP